jgi:ABC-type multidrug transport system ATPase subunit
VHISLHQVGKRFNRQWIFKGVTASFTGGQSYAIEGPNGSGKSTLLQVLAGSMLHSQGEILYQLYDNKIPSAAVYRHVGMAAPYLELIEELTLTEFLHFHSRFKTLLPGHTSSSVIERLGLRSAAHLQLRLFSSGMKQRVKLAQAFFFQTELLVLDEPTANLDAEGIALYFWMVEHLSANRLLLVGSNDAHETRFCNHRLYLPDYK